MRKQFFNIFIYPFFILFNLLIQTAYCEEEIACCDEAYSCDCDEEECCEEQAPCYFEDEPYCEIGGICNGNQVAWYASGLIGYTAGKTVGLNSPYGTIGGQLGGVCCCDGLYMGLEGYWYANDKKRHAANANLVLRWYDPGCDVYWGLLGFFDYRHAKIGRFYQAGGGFEAYFSCFFLNGNFYLPVGKKRRFSSTTVFDDFVGGFVASCKEQQASLRGFNIDIGKEIGCFPCLTFTPTIGPYYFKNHNTHFWGGKFGAVFTYCSRIGVDVIVTHDRWFGTRVTGGLFVSFPLGCGIDAQCCPYFRRVNRFEWIPLTDNCCWKWNW